MPLTRIAKPTGVKTKAKRLRLTTLIAGALCACVVAVASHADEGSESKPVKAFDVKNTFRNICGFCHADYGRHAGKGPQLMDSESSDTFMFKRIQKGKPGRMAAFGSVFSDDQINQIVVFIRNLKPDEEPQNP
jgi:mono/diheme cytochrome c family protein